MSAPTAPWRVVAVREMVVRLTNRAFIVSTLVMLAIIAGSMGLQVVLAGREQVTRVAVVDTAGKQLAERVGRAMHAEDDLARVEVTQVQDVAAARAAVQAEDVDAYLARTPDGWELVSRTDPPGMLSRQTQQIAAADALAANAATQGTTVPALMQGAQVSTRTLDTQTSDREGLSMVVAMVFSILFMLSSLTFGMQIASSIVEEKASRVVEIVAAAIPVRQLLAGKVVGNTVLAVGQIVLFVAVGLVGVAFTSMSSFLSPLLRSAGWYVVFFLAGFLALACLWALAGALATRQEDLQSTTSPMTGILMVAYIAGFSAKGTAMTVLSFVPVVSTTLMPVRLLRGDAPWWQAVLSLLITIAFAVATVLFSERLYRRSLLQTQGRLSVRQAMALED